MGQIAVDDLPGKYDKYRILYFEWIVLSRTLQGA
jgi:hypothetical protein